jgi:hypothetical protein
MPAAAQTGRAGLCAVLLFGTALLLSGFFFGCRGPAGPPGEDAGFRDVAGPELRLLNPPAGLPLVDSVVTLTATTLDPEDRAERVLFTVNGSPVAAGDSALGVTTDSTLWRYELPLTPLPYGLLAVRAVGWDTAGNRAASPELILTRPHPDSALVQDLSRIPGTAERFSLPVVLGDGTSGGGDTLDALALPVTLPRRYRLDSLAVTLAAGAGFSPPGALRLLLYESAGQDSVPTALLDSLLIEPNEIDLDKPLTLDLHRWRGDSAAWILEPGRRYFAVLEPGPGASGFTVWTTHRTSGPLARQEELQFRVRGAAGTDWRAHANVLEGLRYPWLRFHFSPEPTE